MNWIQGDSLMPYSGISESSPLHCHLKKKNPNLPFKKNYGLLEWQRKTDPMRHEFWKKKKKI